jgi:hypothetical protein
LAYAFVAKLQLGHWPYYGHPDPKQMGWPEPGNLDRLKS